MVCLLYPHKTGIKDLNSGEIRFYKQHGVYLSVFISYAAETIFLWLPEERYCICLPAYPWLLTMCRKSTGEGGGERETQCFLLLMDFSGTKMNLPG